jgi:hypothetical protein
LVRGLLNLNRLDPGFQVKNVFLTALDLELQHYDASRAAEFYRDLLPAIDAQTGARSALAAIPPFSGVRIVGLSKDGQATGLLGEVNSNIVSATTST